MQPTISSPNLSVWLLLAMLATSIWIGSAAWCAVPLPTADEIDASDRVVELAPGILIDSGQGIAYFMRPEGGIEALTLWEGSTLWSSEQGDKPLVAYGDLLLTQTDLGKSEKADTTPLLLLDRRSGETRSTLDMQLPRSASLSGGPELIARVQEGELLVAWRPQERRLQALPDRSRSRPAKADPSERAFRIDLGSERAIAIPSERVSKAPKRLERRAADPPLPSLDGAPVILELPSADQRHMLLSQRVAPGQPDEYLWTFVTRSTGEILAEIRADTSFAHFYIRDKRLIFEQKPAGDLVDGRVVFGPKKLICVDLHGESLEAAEVWAHEVRDLTYRGPLPH